MLKTATKITDTSSRFYILDPLRLVAALMVLIYHYSIFFNTNNFPVFFASATKFGYLGVVFFFLLSGFVITASAQGRSAVAFLVARGIRLYPAFIICLLVTVTTIYCTGHGLLPIKQIIANATILNDYLKVPNVDGVYWTLQAELKFYGCIFLLIATGVFNFYRVWLSIWLLIAILHFYTNNPFFMGWFINPYYSFYSIGGVSCFLLHKHPRDILMWGNFLLSLGFGVVMASHQTHDFNRGVTTADANLAVIIVAFFYLFFLLLALGYFQIKPHKGFVLAGAISYPLYLIHNEAGKALIYLLQVHTGAVCAVIAVTIIVIVAAVFIHIILEKKLQRLLKKVLPF
jgi:peptidoglycan/LPS O-acetylase OafA/YrhL